MSTRRYPFQPKILILKSIKVFFVVKTTVILLI